MDLVEFISEIFLKTDSNTEVFLHGFYKIDIFKISNNLSEISLPFFPNKVAGAQFIGCHKVYIRISIPIPMPRFLNGC